jgi:hypothetical protein
MVSGASFAVTAGDSANITAQPVAGQLPSRPIWLVDPTSRFMRSSMPIWRAWSRPGRAGATCSRSARWRPISYDDVVQVIEDEGVAKFEASWNELLDTIKKNMGL